MSDTAPPEVPRPLISLSDPPLRKRSSGSVAKRFSSAFDALFRFKILPRAGTFLPEKQTQYVSSREWLADEFEMPKGVYPYEDLLDQLFWKESHKPTVFVVGEVGVGKSTLIDFYLRGACPQSHPSEYEEKLIVTIDFQGASTPEGFDREFYSGIRKVMTDELRDRWNFDLVSHDNYAVWDFVMQWRSAHHQHAQRAQGKDLDHYRSELVGTFLATVDDRKWTECVFDYVHRVNGNNNAVALPFKYLVLCLDNLDQSPPDVQAHAISVVHKWQRHSDPSPIWQTYVPLRPETFAALSDVIRPLPDHWLVLVGAPNMARILSLRTEAATEMIRTAGGSAQVEGADIDESSMITNSNCRRYLKEAFEISRPAFVAVLESFAAGSIRRLLELWKTTLSSDSLERSFNKSQFMGIGRLHALGLYPLCDAFITGVYPVHHRNESRVANLFFAASPSQGADGLGVLPSVPTWQTSLIGVHLLELLRSGMDSIQDIYDYLFGIGYAEATIDLAMRYLASKEIFQEYKLKGVRMLDVRHRIVQGHADMLHMPVYYDNMAMVSPVESHWRNQMKVTRGHRNQQFIDRVSTSMLFLSKLDKDQRAMLMEGGPENQSRRRVLLKERAIPNIVRRAARAYEERLNELYVHDKKLVPNDEKWEALRSRGALPDFARQSELLGDLELLSEGSGI